MHRCCVQPNRRRVQLGYVDLRRIFYEVLRSRNKKGYERRYKNSMWILLDAHSFVALVDCRRIQLTGRASGIDLSISMLARYLWIHIR